MNKITTALLTTVLSISTASALTIKNDSGGNLATRDKVIHALLVSGEPVRLTGDCRSSCTQILTLPPYQICATKNARLGFHAVMRASKSGSDDPLLINNKPVLSRPSMQERFIVSFADEVKDWLRKSGALTSVKMTYVPATKFMRLCDDKAPPPVEAYQPASIYTWKNQFVPRTGKGGAEAFIPIPMLKAGQVFNRKD